MQCGGCRGIGSGLVDDPDNRSREDRLWLASSYGGKFSHCAFTASGDVRRVAVGRCSNRVVCLPGSLWLLLMAARRNGLWLAVAAGLTLGIACWLRVDPLYLAPCWAIAVVVLGQAPLRKRLALGALLVAASAATISPIVIRNFLVFPDFTPTGGTDWREPVGRIGRD